MAADLIRVFRVVVAFLLTTGASAHYCLDGSRIACMEVVDKHSALPLCTLSGQQVYCAVGHYHDNCGSSAAPCCKDGSSPSNKNPHKPDAVENKCPVGGSQTVTTSGDVVANNSTQHEH